MGAYGYIGNHAAQQAQQAWENYCTVQRMKRKQENAMRDTNFETALAGLRKGEHWSRRSWKTTTFLTWVGPHLKINFDCGGRLGDEDWGSHLFSITAKDWYRVRGAELSDGAVEHIRDENIRLARRNKDLTAANEDLQETLDRQKKRTEVWAAQADVWQTRWQGLIDDKVKPPAMVYELKVGDIVWDQGYFKAVTDERIREETAALSSALEQSERMQSYWKIRTKHLEKLKNV